MKQKTKAVIDACKKILDVTPGNPYSLNRYVDDQVALGDMPSYSIARSVEMPDGYKYPHGALSFRMTDLQCAGVSKIDIGGIVDGSKENQARLNFKLAGLELKGRYVLESKEDPLITMDTAGNLSELSRSPQAGGAEEEDPTITEKQFDQLQQARGQRDKLNKTPNGKPLVDTFNEHNEVYNAIFRNNKSLRQKWPADGATQEMADHTSDAISKDQVINPDKSIKTFGPNKVSYNENAFQQQNYVTMACLFPPPNIPPDEKKKYDAAAKAASSFKQKVVAGPGKGSEDIKPKTPTEVYGYVDSDSGEWPEVTDEHLDAYRKIAMGPEEGGKGENIEVNGIVFSPNDRKAIREMYAEMMKQYAEDAKIERIPLWEGHCTANLHGADIAMDLQTWDIKVTLPAFDLEIDDSMWTGAAAKIARKRLMQAHFLRGLIHEYVTDRLKQVFSIAVEKALNAAL